MLTSSVTNRATSTHLFVSD